MKGYEKERERERDAQRDEDEGKTEMGSAVNIGLNREAIGMNRSGMTLLPDLNLFEYFFSQPLPSLLPLFFAFRCSAKSSNLVGI